MRNLKLVFVSVTLILTFDLNSCGQVAPQPTLTLESLTHTSEPNEEPAPSATIIAPTPRFTLTNTSTPSYTPSPTPTSLPACSPELCTYPGHFLLARPIDPQFNDNLDISYRYGSTQEGVRPTHHGIEFPNEEGTPVLAVAMGTVVVAGDDSQEAFADFPFYYGNLVVIEHDFPLIGVPVFTLYGHLSEVRTQVGEIVKAGDEIGAVGYTGVAIWSHLHFEVRVGKNGFHHTRNPELWLQPHLNKEGTLNGAIAGRIVDEYGDAIYIPNIFIERINADGERSEIILCRNLCGFHS